jgi:hypothetical protein
MLPEPGSPCTAVWRRPAFGLAGSPFQDKENDMEPVYADKAKVIADLRSRQLHARADWVDRQLPDLIDTYKNSSLFKMLGIDPDAMVPGEAAASRS